MSRNPAMAARHAAEQRAMIIRHQAERAALDDGPDSGTSVPRMDRWTEDAIAEALNHDGTPMGRTHARAAIMRLLTEAYERGQRSPLNVPSRFHASPREVHDFLSTYLAEDVHENYQRAIAEAGVCEAADEIRASNHPDAAADLIDPRTGGGRFPARLVRLEGKQYTYRWMES